jgi:hypothetical protein
MVIREVGSISDDTSSAVQSYATLESFRWREFILSVSESLLGRSRRAGRGCDPLESSPVIFLSRVSRASRAVGRRVRRKKKKKKKKRKRTKEMETETVLNIGAAGTPFLAFLEHRDILQTAPKPSHVPSMCA